VRGTRERDQSVPAVRLPILVAGLIVVGSVTLAVYTLRRTADQRLSEESTRAAGPDRGSDPVVKATARPRTDTRSATRAALAGTPRAASPTPRSTPSPGAPSPTPRLPDAARSDAPPPTARAAPAATATPASTAPAGPTTLINVAPPRVKRNGNTLLDVHGVALRADHHAVVLRGGHSAADVLVTRQKLVGSTLVQVLVAVSATAKGSYELIVLDGQGNRSNGVSFEVVH
jgi:hypothetical protein